MHVMQANSADDGRLYCCSDIACCTDTDYIECRSSLLVPAVCTYDAVPWESTSTQLCAEVTDSMKSLVCSTGFAKRLWRPGRDDSIARLCEDAHLAEAAGR